MRNRCWQPRGTVDRQRSVVLWALLVLGTSTACAQTEARDALVEGVLSFGGAIASRVASSTALSAEVEVNWTKGRWQHIANAESYIVRTRVVRLLTNDMGEPIVNENGETQFVAFQTRTTDRSLVAYQPRWFWESGSYILGLLDVKRDHPANVDYTDRQILGMGIEALLGDSNSLWLEVGAGRRGFRPLRGTRVDDEIGYAGARLRSALSEEVLFDADLSADVGGGEEFAELDISLTFSLSANTSLRVRNVFRRNGDLLNRGESDNAANNSVTSINVVFDI